MVKWYTVFESILLTNLHCWYTQHRH